MDDPRLAGGNFTTEDERKAIISKYDKVCPIFNVCISYE